MYASFSSALTTRKERSGESGSKPKWRKTTTRGEMVSHGERREYGRSRERGGARGAPSNARETWSRPGRSTKWRRRTHRPPSGSSLALAVASLGGSFLSFSRSGASPTHPPLVVVLWFPLVGPAVVEKDCLALGPQSPKPYRLSWCCVLPRGSVPRFPPARVYLVAPLPAPQAFPLFRCLSSSDRSSTEPPSNFSQFKIQSQISNNFFSSLAPSPGKEGGSA